MSIYKTAINKPVSTLMIFLAVVIVGVFSFSRLPIDSFPEMEPPYITVMTTYPGASASEIETNVTKIIENAVNSTEGLKELSSQSKDNLSMVTLELEWGTNMDEVMNDIRSYVDMAKDRLPDGCSTPFLLKFSSSMMPVIQFAITAEESYPGLDKILNDIVVPQLNRVNGIGNITVAGAPDRYVYVDLDQEKLDSYGLSLEQVGQAVQTNNLNLASGIVKMNKEQYNLQVRSEFQESSEINDLVVTTLPTGQKVFIRDIATVRDTIKDLSLDEKINGMEGVRLMVSKQSGANTVQICEGVKKELERLKPQLPSDINIDIIYDTSDNIKNAVGSLEESLLYALLFVILVVFVFLGRWRATIIIGITIPISLIVAFIYLLVSGSSLNIISLSSLTVAIGMVVDDAIVVLENITKHIDRGSNPREAAIYATNEVWTSVIATTMVVAATFIPLTMLKGMAGVMFKELGWIITIVVTTSTVIAISLTPMLCSKLLKARKIKINADGRVEDDEKGSLYDKTVLRFLDFVDKYYAKSLKWCVNHKFITICIALGIFGVSLIPVFQGKIGTDFMPQEDNGRLSCTIELQRGTRIEETLLTARQLEKRIFELVPECIRISTSAGSNDESSVGAIFSSTTNNKISMTVVCNKKYERERTIFEIAEIIRREFATYPEITRYQCTVASSMGGGGGAQTVDVEIYGYDFDDTNIFAAEVEQICRHKVKGARDVSVSRDEDRPELKIVVDKEKLAMHGLSAVTVSTYVRNRVNGMLVGYLKEDGDEYDIVVRLKEENRNTISEIEDLTIPLPMGGSVKLHEVASIVEHWAPPTIERSSRQRVVKVKVYPYETSLGELAANIQAELSQIGVPNGITYRLGGSYEDQQESFGDMTTLGLLILLLVYVVMATQFESISKPAIIFTSIPFAITGVILALGITGKSLDMIGALGLIMLLGIVVKNGIVLVDYTDLLRERGYALNDAIVRGGKSRLRPVMMTAFTTLLGMVPMAISNGEGSEMWQPLGIVVIGGLLVSTFVTMYIVPIVYGILSARSEKKKLAGAGNSQFIFMQLSDEQIHLTKHEEEEI